MIMLIWGFFLDIKPFFFFFFCHCAISWLHQHVVPQNTPSKGTDWDWERTATTFHCPLSDAIPRCVHTACSLIRARVEIITEIGQEHVNINHSITHNSKAATCYGFTGIYFSPHSPCLSCCQKIILIILIMYLLYKKYVASQSEPFKYSWGYKILKKILKKPSYTSQWRWTPCPTFFHLNKNIWVLFEQWNLVLNILQMLERYFI